MADLDGSNPVYFTSLELENVRCFRERQVLNLSRDNGGPAPWTLILGDNNLGKTTLLQCLAWMRPEPEPPQQEQTDSAVEKAYWVPSLLVEENEVFESLIPAGGGFTVELVARLCRGQDLDSNDRGEEVRTGIKIFSERGKLINQEPIRTHLEDIGKYKELRIIAYGANRHMGAQNVTNKELEDPIASRLSGFTELYDAEEILLKLDHAALKANTDSKAVRNLQKFKSILAKVLPGLSSSEDVLIYAPKLPTASEEPTGVRFQTFSGIVPMSGLSLGYQTMIAWVVDLAWRLLDMYPESENPLAEPAVVMVDEIDLHLHPKWQRTIARNLTSLFPKTQFITTAHSPLMAQAAEEENIAVLTLDTDHVTIKNDPHMIQGWRIDQIVTSELFGVASARGERVEVLIKERDSILGKVSRILADEERLKEIDKELSRLPTEEKPEDQEALEIIRRAADLLKNASPTQS